MFPENKLNIFFIEDSEMYSLLLDQKLKNIANFRINTYTSAEEAIKELYLNPSLIILDYYLPGMNGMEALQQIKNQRPDIPVIILSSQQDIQVALDVLKAGAYDYISKSKLSIEELYNTIHKVCTERKLDKDSITKNRKLNRYNLFTSALLIVLLSLIIFIVYAKGR